MIIAGGTSLNIIGAKPYVMDVDASKVIEAIRATGVQPTHAMRNYAHTICSGLKGTGMWQNSVALYGMLGGTAASHKFNWKDLRDLDVAFRLVFNGGGWTHNSAGAKPNGVTSWGDTYIIPSVDFASDVNFHLSVYTNTNSDGQKIDIGTGDSGGINTLALYLKFNNTLRGYSYVIPTNLAIATIPSSVGYSIYNRNSSTDSRLFKNGVLLTISSVAKSGVVPTTKIAIGALYNGASFSNVSDRNYEFISIGSGLTDQQAISSSQVITQAQSILGRA